AALDAIAKAGCYAQSGAGAVIIDGRFTTLFVRDGRHHLIMSASEPITSQGAWVKSWRIIRSEASSLIPGPSKQIPRPDIDGWLHVR
ncbi:MAG TPA: hypothetical protein VMI31_12185, partial [Fimbriimonadaceae bacterium]|nr:hypothetical protein [Fimbriimonadaceae bacterium]